MSTQVHTYEYTYVIYFEYCNVSATYVVLFSYFRKYESKLPSKIEYESTTTVRCTFESTKVLCTKVRKYNVVPSYFRTFENRIQYVYVYNYSTTYESTLYCTFVQRSCTFERR